MTNIRKLLIVLSLIPSFSFAQKTVPTKAVKKNRSISSEALVIPCEEQVLNTLGTLEPPMEWMELSFGPVKTEGVRVFKSLTPTADTQLGLAISKDKALVQRRDRLSLNEYTFDVAKKCVGTISTTQFKKAQPPMKAQFTDFDLKKIVD
ncbi:hypothetical protein [Bdellovibrio sp. BCCA]|uniref:hypothetical protein n=1 Tax=Bdellovibrio sp. BCCA TaxID=3136281 RepID=UPI0030F183CF